MDAGGSRSLANGLKGAMMRTFTDQDSSAARLRDGVVRAFLFA